MIVRGRGLFLKGLQVEPLLHLGGLGFGPRPVGLEDGKAIHEARMAVSEGQGNCTSQRKTKHVCGGEVQGRQCSSCVFCEQIERKGGIGGEGGRPVPAQVEADEVERRFQSSHERC